MRTNPLHLLLLLLVVLIPSRLPAVVLADGDGSANTTAPADDPGFNNVLGRGEGSAVYLGNRWVLTAAHIKAGPVNVGGVTYDPVPESIVRLDNVLGLNSPTDMVLFQLADDPGLKSLWLGCEPLGLGEEVVLIGRGRDRVAEPSFWKRTVKAGANNDSWEAVAEPDSNIQGFHTEKHQTIRWGKNAVSQIDRPVEVGWGEVLSFQMTFDDRFAVENESQAVFGDSGGAAFYKNGPIWELAGMIHAVAPFENQPGRTNTAVFGNLTYAAQVSSYGELLLSIADFQPAAGDFDGDGELSLDDLELIRDQIDEGSTVCHFDLNQDHLLTSADFDRWLVEAEVLVGDANLNGSVDFADFLALSNNFGRQDANWGQGDFDGDDEIGFGDFLLLAARFGDDFQHQTTMAAAVPEPSTGYCALTIVSLLLAFRRRRPRLSAAIS